MTEPFVMVRVIRMIGESLAHPEPPREQPGVQRDENGTVRERAIVRSQRPRPA